MAPRASRPNLVELGPPEQAGNIRPMLV